MMDVRTRKVLPTMVKNILDNDKRVKELTIYRYGVMVTVGYRSRYVNLETLPPREAREKIKTMIDTLAECPL